MVMRSRAGRTAMWIICGLGRSPVFATPALVSRPSHPPVIHRGELRSPGVWTRALGAWLGCCL